MRLPRYDTERSKLETILPLATPFSLYIDPSTICNFSCGFCPTADRELMRTVRHVGVMDFNLYRKIIDDLSEFEKPVKAVHLYIDGEPLINKDFANMVRYAKNSGCVGKVNTTTNASLLSPELNFEIIEAGIDRINISICGMDENQYFKFAGAKVDFNRLVGNIRHLCKNRGSCKIIIKINGDVISKDDENRFLEIFEPMATGVNIEHVMSCWPEFDLKKKGLKANKDLGIYGQPIEEVLVCPYVFYSMAIHPDGMVSACFLDWSRKLIIGDVKTQSIKNIWRGAPFHFHRIMMLQGKRKSHPVCGNCDQLRRGFPDNIDSDREVLLGKLIKQ